MHATWHLKSALKEQPQKTCHFTINIVCWHTKSFDENLRALEQSALQNIQQVWDDQVELSGQMTLEARDMFVPLV